MIMYNAMFVVLEDITYGIVPVIPIFANHHQHEILTMLVKHRQL